MLKVIIIIGILLEYSMIFYDMAFSLNDITNARYDKFTWRLRPFFSVISCSPFCWTILWPSISLARYGNPGCHFDKRVNVAQARLRYSNYCSTVGKCVKRGNVRGIGKVTELCFIKHIKRF